jgi:hypothetical protein
MYKHTQIYFNFIKEFVYRSEESIPNGGDVNCLGRFVRK